MIEPELSTSPAKYYTKAKEMLDKKDLVGFLLKIGIAIETAQIDKKMLAKALFLKAKGLVTFNQHSKVLECIDEALKYNIGPEAFELKK